jgi:hypothetical protein
MNWRPTLIFHFNTAYCRRNNNLLENWTAIMITCHLKYEVDAKKLEEFEIYAKMWIPLVEKFGGTHHGYFLPSEGASDIAYALFSFPSLATYEQYRNDSFSDPDCLKAFKYYKETQCFSRYERNFMRPVLEG